MVMLSTEMFVALFVPSREHSQEEDSQKMCQAQMSYWPVLLVMVDSNLTRCRTGWIWHRCCSPVEMAGVERLAVVEVPAVVSLLVLRMFALRPRTPASVVPTVGADEETEPLSQTYTDDSCGHGGL